jgi:hypothetical protein
VDCAMTQNDRPEINTDELDWDNAVVREGRPHGAVVSVRLDPAEAARLRSIAASLGVNLSQVLRRALADYDPTQAARKQRGTASGVIAITFGGGVATWQRPLVTSRKGSLFSDEPTESGWPGDATSTEPTRIFGILSERP